MIAKITLFKAYAATVCFGFTLAFFFAPHGWFQLALAYALIGIFVIILDLWLSHLPQGEKILWTVLIVAFNIISMPIYWFVVIRKKESINTRKVEADCQRKFVDESIACGLLALFLGPFAFLPGIVLSHLAFCRMDATAAKKLKSRIAIGFSINYGLAAIWSILILAAIREFLSVP